MNRRVNAANAITAEEAVAEISAEKDPDHLMGVMLRLQPIHRHEAFSVLHSFSDMLRVVRNTE